MSFESIPPPENELPDTLVPRAINAAFNRISTLCRQAASQGQSRLTLKADHPAFADVWADSRVYLGLFRRLNEEGFKLTMNVVEKAARDARDARNRSGSEGETEGSLDADDEDASPVPHNYTVSLWGWDD